MMMIRNDGNYAVTNVKLRVTAYSEYYSGDEEVEIAFPHGDISDTKLDYRKELTIDSIAAHDDVPIYIRLTDKMMDMFYHAACIYRFRITIE